MTTDDGLTIGETAAESGSSTNGESGTEHRLSPETVRTLYEDLGTELMAFLVGVLRNVSDANDVFQTSFRRVLEVGHTVRDETIKGWVFKMAMREALVYRRKGNRLARNLEKYSRDCETFQQSPSFEERLMMSEEVARIKPLLAQLPADQYHVVRQRIYEDKTFAVIADELAVPLGTVLTRMRMALEKLRNWLNDD